MALRILPLGAAALASVLMAGVSVSSEAAAVVDRQGHGHHGHAHHHGGKNKNRADLDMVATDAAFSGGEVKVSFLVRNRGRLPAAANQGQISISLDDTSDGIDTIVGPVSIPALGPHKSQQVDTVLPIPVSLTPTYYHVIACADAQRTVKERSRFNNCRGTRDYMLTPAVFRADPTKGGTVTVSNVTGLGGCDGTLCGFKPGTGTVTFTPKADPSYRFAGWSGCTGFTPGPGDSITFSKFGRSQACKATFAALLDVHWSTTGSGSVSASLAPPTCTAAGASGSCTVSEGASLTLTANASVLWRFTSWSAGPGGACDGTKNGATITFNSVTAAESCVATFSFL